MALPVTTDYLAAALVKERTFADMTLRQQRIADLRLPTGSLIACDPFVFSGGTPFELPMARGSFPVILSVAYFSNDQRVAFASIRFRETAPVVWDMLTLDGQNTATLQEGHYFGYGVDSGTGCFIDAVAAERLDRQMNADPDFYEQMMAEMERTYVHTWSWLDMPFGNGNLVAFSSGVGDGAYATYSGFDVDGEIAVVVTDFSILPSDVT